MAWNWVEEPSPHGVEDRCSRIVLLFEFRLSTLEARAVRAQPKPSPGVHGPCASRSLLPRPSFPSSPGRALAIPAALKSRAPPVPRLNPQVRRLNRRVVNPSPPTHTKTSLSFCPSEMAHRFTRVPALQIAAQDGERGAANPGGSAVCLSTALN